MSPAPLLYPIQSRAVQMGKERKKKGQLGFGGREGPLRWVLKAE